MTYKALVCEGIRNGVYEGIEAMKIVTRESPQLRPKQVRVRVRAAGLNFPELLMLEGKYQFKPPAPFVMCSEACGDVEEVGSAVKNVRPGQRVMFQSLSPGTCSTEWVGPADALVPLPDTLTYSEGAGFLMGYTTGYHALVQRGNLQPGEWLLVTGAGGGMGIAAVQLGKALGARVIAAASSDEKLAACREAGADATVNYSKEQLKAAVGKITGGKFCDVIYEPVGGDIFDQCVRCVATRGGARLLVVGFASGRIPKLPANMALIKGFSLVGVRMGHQIATTPELLPPMLKHLCQLASDGKLRPKVGSSYTLNEAKQAFRLMADRKVVAKCVITMPEAASKL